MTFLTYTDQVVHMNKLKLSDDNSIPSLGLGLWKIKDEAQFNQMFQAAVKTGYRHFDCAQAYGNEQFLGKAWREAGLKREDIFITTKSLFQHFGYKSTMESFEGSLKKLQTDHVDLLLIHFPGPFWLRKSKWRALEEIKRAGKARSIGVSNYSVSQLREMENYAKEMPVINQIEMHVFLQQEATREYCQNHNIQVEAYSPLAHGRIMGNPTIQQIANKYNKSYSQIMLRWCIEQGAIPLPKTVTPKRLIENADIFDFKLDNEDLEQIKTLERNFRTIWHSILFG